MEDRGEWEVKENCKLRVILVHILLSALCSSNYRELEMFD